MNENTRKAFVLLAGAAVLAVTFVTVQISDVVMDAEGQVAPQPMYVNNMQCAHFKALTTDYFKRAQVSGPPFEDIGEPRTRDDCNSILGYPQMDSYAVAPPSKGDLRAELFIKKTDPEKNAKARVGLRHGGDGGGVTWSAWRSPGLQGANELPKRYWNDVRLALPYSAIPTVVDFTVILDPEVGSLVSDDGYIWVYHGPFGQAAYIEDLTGGNAYVSTLNFTQWIVDDPEGDDVLWVGGVPLVLEPGTVITLTAYGQRVEYTTGTQWVIESDDGTERSFVWHDEEDGSKWRIYELQY